MNRQTSISPHCQGGYHRSIVTSTSHSILMIICTMLLLSITCNPPANHCCYIYSTHMDCPGYDSTYVDYDPRYLCLENHIVHAFMWTNFHQNLLIECCCYEQQCHTLLNNVELIRHNHQLIRDSSTWLKSAVLVQLLSKFYITTGPNHHHALNDNSNALNDNSNACIFHNSRTSYIVNHMDTTLSVRQASSDCCLIIYHHIVYGSDRGLDQRRTATNAKSTHMSNCIVFISFSVYQQHNCTRHGNAPVSAHLSDWSPGVYASQACCRNHDDYPNSVVTAVREVTPSLRFTYRPQDNSPIIVLHLHLAVRSRTTTWHRDSCLRTHFTPDIPVSAGLWYVHSDSTTCNITGQCKALRHRPVLIDPIRMYSKWTMMRHSRVLVWCILSFAHTTTSLDFCLVNYFWLQITANSHLCIYSDRLAVGCDDLYIWCPTDVLFTHNIIVIIYSNELHYMISMNCMNEFQFNNSNCYTLGLFWLMYGKLYIYHLYGTIVLQNTSLNINALNRNRVNSTMCSNELQSENFSWFGLVPLWLNPQSMFNASSQKTHETRYN